MLPEATPQQKRAKRKKMGSYALHVFALEQGGSWKRPTTGNKPWSQEDNGSVLLPRVAFMWTPPILSSGTHPVLQNARGQEGGTGGRDVRRECREGVKEYRASCGAGTEAGTPERDDGGEAQEDNGGELLPGVALLHGLLEALEAGEDVGGGGEGGSGVLTQLLLHHL